MGRIPIGLVCCVGFTINGASRADEISLSFETPGVYGREIHYSYDPAGDHSQALLSGDTIAGRFDWTVVSKGPVAFGGLVFNNGDHFSTFATELTGFVTPGETYTYDSVAVRDMPGNGGNSPLGFFREGLLQDLFDSHYSQAIDGNKLQAAAFQVAVWEIVYEDRLAELGSGGGPTLSELLVADDGTFIVSNDNAVVNMANAWLAQLTGTVFDSALLGFNSGTESVVPGQILLPAVVPLPAPLWLAGLGLVAVVAGRKKLRWLAGT